MNTYQMFLSEERVPYLKKGKRLPGKACRTPEDIWHLMDSVFYSSSLPEEHVWMLTMDAKCRVTGVFELAHGTVSNSLLSPREVFMRALLAGATAIAVVHNHPSLDVNPSEQDIKIAKKLYQAGKYIDITLVDFLIVGDGYYSFNEEDVLKQFD